MFTYVQGYRYVIQKHKDRVHLRVETRVFVFPFFWRWKSYITESYKPDTDVDELEAKIRIFLHNLGTIAFRMYMDSSK